MSFRARSRTIQPVVPRRSASLTRSGSGSTVNNSGASGNGYHHLQSRPFSVGYSNLNSPKSYLNNHYNSTDSTYSPTSRTPSYFDYSSANLRRDGSSYGSNSNLNSLSNNSNSSYKSPYKDKDRYGSNSSSYTSAYKDRYVSPYTNYDNGITTAGLNFSVGGSSGSSNSNSNSATSSYPKRDYSLRNTNLLSSVGSGLSGSNTSLNSYSNSSPSSNVGRSQSLREHERKSRTRSRLASQQQQQQQQAIQQPSNTPSVSRSLSTASIHSEGYEVRHS